MNPISWQGVYSALLTPFTKDDAIDYPLFEKNLNCQVEAGVEGIIIAGSLGEANTLSLEEKRELLICSKALLPEHIPVVMNIAEQSTKGGIASVVDADRNGADALMFLPPMRYKADETETMEYFSALAMNTALPIMIYNNPYDYKIEVTPDMLEELLKFNHIQAIKESTRDVSNVTRLKNRFGNRLKILCGVDTLAFEELAAGADGWIAGLVDAFPRETVAIFRLMKAGRYKEARKIYRWFLPMLELDIHPKLVQYIKMAATRMEIGSEFVRAPRLMIKGEERETVLNIINKSLQCRPTLPDYLQLERFPSEETECMIFNELILTGNINR